MTEKKKTWKKIVSILLVLLLIALAAGLLIKQEGEDLPVLGIGFYSVLSQSMSPTFNAGSLVVVKRTPPEHIREGDILTFHIGYDDNTLVTHRVVEVLQEAGEYQFVTRGDANNINDRNPVTPELMVGKVIFWFSGVGFLMTNLRPLLLAILVGLLVFWILMDILKKQGKKEKSNEDQV